MKPEDVPEELVEIACVACANWGRAEDGVPLLKSSQETCFADEFRERMRATLAAVIPLVQAAEREACAKVAEDLRHPDYTSETDDWLDGAAAAANAIRARNTP